MFIRSLNIYAIYTYARVCTGLENPGKSLNMIKINPCLEKPCKFGQVLESPGIFFRACSCADNT